MNRIVAVIARMEAIVAEKKAAGALTDEKIEASRKALDMDWEEYTIFQNLKSLASTDGTLTLDEANTVYSYLGETLDHFNNQSFPVKLVLNKLLAQLLDKKIKGLAA